MTESIHYVLLFKISDRSGPLGYIIIMHLDFNKALLMVNAIQFYGR